MKRMTLLLLNFGNKVTIKFRKQNQLFHHPVNELNIGNSMERAEGC